MVKKKMNFVLVKNLDEVIKNAMEKIGENNED